MSRFDLGLTGTLVHQVARADTAAEWGNELEVLATPVLFWLAEVACMKALEGHLQPHEMTLGGEHGSGHLAPTPIDFVVTVTATLIKEEGRRLTFGVTATDGIDTVLEGTHVRFLVDRSRFVQKVTEKAAKRQMVKGGSDHA